MRTKKSIRNVLSSLIGQFFGIIINLITRAFFVKTLTSDLLGLDGLFSNILTLLSLVELGVGPAMTYSMYKPLANKDNEKIKSLIKLYKKLYFSIGGLIFIIGISIIPFLKYFINSSVTIDNIYLIYILYLVNSCISYFYSYKNSLLITDQRKYIYNIYHYICMVAYNIIQIITLIIYHNYILFLASHTIFILIENILLVRKTNKLYPFIKEKNVKELDKEESSKIAKNIKAMVMHKIGSVVINATDNIILSKYVGLNAVALYSNYLLITNNLKKIITQIFDSVIASIGNLVAEGNNKKIYEIFNKMFFFNYYIYTVICVCLFILFNDFIYIWVGKDYLFNTALVFIIVLNFFLSGMRKTVLAFRDAMGLYWYDRYKPIIEAIINIIFSIILGKKYGTIGVLIGTLISNVSTNLWIEPLVLYKYGFKHSVSDYYKKYIIYFITFLIYTFTINYIVNYIFKVNTLILFIGKTIITFILINLILIITNKKNENFLYYFNLFKKNIKKRKKVNNNVT